MANPGRQTRGRQRVALERMEKDSNRLVTYSKRSQGILKKASELCTLCGVQALCIIFSPANKPMAFGHPSVEAIINRFLHGGNNLPHDNRVSTEPLLRSLKEVSLLKDQIDVEKKRTEEILKERKVMSEEAQQFLSPPETFTYSELKQIQATLKVLKNNVLTHGHNLEAQSNMNLNPTQIPGPSTLDGQNSQQQNPFFNPSNMLVGQNYNLNPTLVESQTTPTFGDQTQMTMVPPPLVRDPNDNIMMGMIPTPMSTLNDPTLAMRSNFMNTGFTHPNIPQAFQGPTNFNPGSFDGQNSMLADMGWNPMPRQTFTNLLMGEGSSNSPAFPFNPQGGRYMGSNPIPGDYQTFQNLLMVDRTLNFSAPPSNPQGGYMGSNPIPGDYQTFRNLMGEGSSNPSNPPFNTQGGFGFGPRFDPGMN